MENLLEIKNLSVDFKTPRGRVHALRDVSFKAPRGKIVGVVGESGSGKSTVVWAMTQLLAGNGVVEGGEILFNGKNLLELSERELQAFRGEEASIVFQDPMTSQIPVLSYAQQMVDITYRQKGKTAAGKISAAIAMMRRVGIPDPEQRIAQYPHQFSGGMRQRVMIAIAISCHPKLIIADEATTALDVTIQAQILDLLKDLARQFGVALILITHNLGVVARYADRINIMYAGSIIERGTTKEIFRDPRHPYTQGLLRSIPRIDRSRRELLETIDGQPPDLIALGEGCPFMPRCNYAIERCGKEFPEETILSDTHRSACWVANELGETVATT